MGGTVCQIADTFQVLVETPLHQALVDHRHLHPEEYALEVAGKTVTSGLFFGLEGNSPIMHLRNFEASHDAKGSIQLVASRLECVDHPSRGIACLRLGNSTAM